MKSVLVIAALILACCALIRAEEAEVQSAAPMNQQNEWVSSIVIDTVDTNSNIERVDYILYEADPVIERESALNRSKPVPSTCFLLNGQKWNRLPVRYVINPANPNGVSEKSLVSAIMASARTWNKAVPRFAFWRPVIDPTAQFAVRDNKNSISFWDLPVPNIIAGTTAWFDLDQNLILESDTFLNSNFAWGDATVEPGVMDIQNIVTHEMGHMLGLADLFNYDCSSATMFAYSSYGETSKRTLEAGDIIGIRAIYGKMAKKHKRMMHDKGNRNDGM